MPGHSHLLSDLGWYRCQWRFGGEAGGSNSKSPKFDKNYSYSRFLAMATRQPRLQRARANAALQNAISPLYGLRRLELFGIF